MQSGGKADLIVSEFAVSGMKRSQMSEDVFDPNEQDAAAPRPRVPPSPNPRVSPSPPLPIAAPVSRSQFSTHVAWTFATRILMVGNSVIAGIIVARWLGAGGLGQLAVINVTVSTLVQLACFGLPSANTYFIARDNQQLRAAATNSLVFAVLIGALLALVLTGLASWRPMVWFYFAKIDRHRCHRDPFSTVDIHWSEHSSGGGPSHAVQPNRFGRTDVCPRQCGHCSDCHAVGTRGTGFIEYGLEHFARSANDHPGRVRCHEIEPTAVAS